MSDSSEPAEVKREIADAVATLRRHGRLRSGRIIRHLPDMPSLAQVEKEYIGKVLSACAGNMTRAALVLGIDRRTLYRKTRGES